MKFCLAIILYTFILSTAPAVAVEGSSNCAAMNKPETQTEFKTCLKYYTDKESQGDSKVVLGTDRSICEGIRSTGDVYNTFMFAQQLGLVKEENFNSNMYRSISSAVNKVIEEKCNRISSTSLMAEAMDVCVAACEPQAIQVAKNKSDKKKIDAMTGDCKTMCKIENFSRLKMNEGMAFERNSKPKAACDPTGRPVMPPMDPKGMIKVK